MADFTRMLRAPAQSFFLFGPRGVGKSSWLKRHFSEATYFNLLDTRLYLELSRDPGLLEAKVGRKGKGAWICIDEIQKIPSLLDEVHRLIEDKAWRFSLTGSSARKLKRGGANLLAGRAITRHMEALTYGEMGKAFDLDRAIAWGTLPLVVARPECVADTLSAYVHTYIREEIREEGLVRKTEPFLRFLEIAAIMNGRQLNKENIARDARVPRATVDTYFSILEDTLLGHFLPAFRPELKVREQAHPKFYWFDPGVARAAAGLLYDAVDPFWRGIALETLIFHELRTYNHTQSKHRPIYFYRTGSGSEIDFIVEIERRQVSRKKGTLLCVEVKSATRWQRSWEGPMRSLCESQAFTVHKMIGVYCGQESLHFDGVDVLPVPVFLERLVAGEWF